MAVTTSTQPVGHWANFIKDLNAMKGCPCVVQWWLEISTPYDYLADYEEKLKKLKEKTLTPNPGESAYMFKMREYDLIKTIGRLEEQIAELKKHPRPRSCSLNLIN